VKYLREIMKYGGENEQDLFVTRFCFEVLIRKRSNNEGVKLVREILKRFEEVRSPLVNLMVMFLEAIELKDFDLFRIFINNYKAHLVRDPKFIEYVDRIAQYYFDG
jgi:hypothetical protein